MKKAAPSPPSPLSLWRELGERQEHGRYRNKTHPHPHPKKTPSLEHEPAFGLLACFCVCECAHMCVHYEANTSITYSSVLSAGLPHCVFQHAWQSLCHMHYLTHALALMQIATQLFISDMLTYCLVWFSHRLQRIHALVPLLRRRALSLPQFMRLHLRAHTLIFIYFDGEIHLDVMLAQICFGEQT